MDARYSKVKRCSDNAHCRNYKYVPREDEKKPAESCQDLQQTPSHAPKVMLKISVKASNSPEATAHTFHFKSGANPREEADRIKDVLSQLLSQAKSNDPSVPRANGAHESSAAMAMASAAASKKNQERFYDNNQLKNDIELQQLLMKKDPTLHRTYMEARRTKPSDLSDSHFNAQFWSTRTTMLRSFAIESSQKRGSYHVLAAVKPREVNGELKMNISAEQVQLIFSQHPLVKRVYDENVPKLNEMEFWSRFFLSRLFKKLKGERITVADSTDAVFDRYLDGNNELLLSQTLLASHVPNIIDLEGNEEDRGGFKSGNRQDFTMRPSALAKVPIVRVLNSLSEKIMTQVKPSDIDPTAPIGIDEETFNELALRDLRADTQEERIVLDIKQQDRYLVNHKSSTTVAPQHEKYTSAEVLLAMRTDLAPQSLGDKQTGQLDLNLAIDIRDDSDDEGGDSDKLPHIGSHSSRSLAQAQVLASIASRRSELLGTGANDLGGLSQRLYDRLVLTHATTTEFLHHFWALFLSGDPNRAEELAKVVSTLDRAMDRINAVAEDAEAERNQIIKRRKEHIRDVFESTRKKLHFDPSTVEGGSNAVHAMMEPTIRTLQRASTQYKAALVAEGVDTS